MLALAPTLAALKWNPTVRGILFPAIMATILVGSSYLILATNLGNRLGFLVANAAFWSWVTLMAMVWMIYGIGPKGNPPHWKPLEVVQDTSNAQYEKVAAIPSKPTGKVPSGWTEVKEGTPTRGEAQSAVDTYIAGTAEGSAGLFKSATAYAPLGAYERGGEQRIKLRPRKIKGKDWWNPSDYRFMGLLHGKHYYVEQVQAYQTNSLGVLVKDADNKPIIDKKAPVYTVVMIRDSGTLRLRSFRVFLAALVMLIISASSLHRRDKQVMAAMRSGKMTPARA